MEKNEIRDALKMDVSTARGRRCLNGREINIKPNGWNIKQCASCRADAYIEIARAIKNEISQSSAGITLEELESAEFVIEQLEQLSRVAHDTAIKNY